MAALHIAKEEEAAVSKERITRSTPNRKVDANIESEGSSYSGRSTRNSRITTKQPKKETKRTATLTEKMKEHAVEAVIEHLKSYIGRRDMRENTFLQRRVTELERKLDKTRKYWHKMKFNMKRGMQILDEGQYGESMKSDPEEMQDASSHKAIGGAFKP